MLSWGIVCGRVEVLWRFSLTLFIFHFSLWRGELLTSDRVPSGLK